MAYQLSPRLKSIYRERRHKAEMLRDQAERELPQQYPDLARLLKRKRKATMAPLINIVKQQCPGLIGGDARVEEDLAEIDDEIARLSREYGYENSFEIPIEYNCMHCCDTGLADGHYCRKCYARTAVACEMPEMAYFADPQNNFDEFDITLFDDENLILSFKRMARKFVSDFIAGKVDKGMYICGPTGTGKTFLISCIFNEIFEAGFDAVFIKAGQFSELNKEKMRLSASFNPDPEELDLNKMRLDKIYESDILFWDDFGTAAIMPGEYKDLLAVFQHFAAENKPMVFSSNLKPRDLDKHFDNRISSRIHDVCLDIFKLEGQDLRCRKRERELAELRGDKHSLPQKAYSKREGVQEAGQSAFEAAE